MKTIEERIFRRLLSEAGAPPTKGLAACVNDTGNKKSATLYAVSALLGPVRSAAGARDDEDMVPRIESNLAGGGVKGFIEIAKPREPTAGAWEVKLSAGPSMGKYVYGMGYALSPSGLLVPDRDIGCVSPNATGGWAKQGGRKSVTLDNFYADKKERRTPKDPSDDAAVHDWNRDPHTKEWRGDDVIDKAYEAEGWEDGFLSELSATHAAAMDEAEDSGFSSDYLEEMIVEAGLNYFGRCT